MRGVAPKPAAKALERGAVVFGPKAAGFTFDLKDVDMVHGTLLFRLICSGYGVF